eukprot:m.1171279 g.1171279  ORF g.1171279 m.1171279 type:complete len:210 (+) comp24514_c0_seq3:446-1075(+)
MASMCLVAVVGCSRRVAREYSAGAVATLCTQARALGGKYLSRAGCAVVRPTLHVSFITTPRTVGGSTGYACNSLRNMLHTTYQVRSVGEVSESKKENTLEQAGLTHGIPANTAFSLTVAESQSTEKDSILCTEVSAALHRMHPQYGPDAVREFADIMVEKLYSKAGQTRFFATEAVTGLKHPRLLDLISNLRLYVQFKGRHASAHLFLN